MPILKQLVSNSAHSKRRSRADLTAEMISAPLGDFRHTMHVGRAGDAFGDTSFLTSKAGEPELNEKEVDRSAGQLPKSLSSSPVKKMPEEMSPEEQQRLNGAAAGPLSPGLDERDFGDITELPVVVAKSGAGMKHAESIMSFHIDLGPSMLGDVLSIMDKEQWEQDEDLEAEESREEGDVAVPGSPVAAQSQSPSRSADGPRDSSAASGCASGPGERSPLPVGAQSQRGPPKRPDKEFSFADEDDDEIRV
ncbi:cdc42 effector protein 4 isoform X2 [Meleagris gallopavo]|uniref:cdc42 effector protein 4 isoform X2 n=1 Tax=Meleagris gallopavo TaxID=9103 RepID=UPI000549B1FE|nr:cdc42 effector protein 4 isoform X2 [Meleagris gallopavo]